MAWRNLLDTVCFFRGQRTDWWLEMDAHGRWVASVFVYRRAYHGWGGAPAAVSGAQASVAAAMEDAAQRAFAALHLSPPFALAN